MSTARNLNNRPNLRCALAENVPEWMKIRLAQRFFTFLTGQAHDGEIMPVRSQPRRVAESFGLFLSGTAAGVTATALAGPAAAFVLPIAWIAAVGGARDLQLTIYHHSAHGNVISAVCSKWIGRCVDKILLIDRFDSYQPKHAVTHHGRHSVSTDADPTVAFLRDVVGMQPGLPVGENLRRLRRALVSPKVHSIMLRARLRSQFVDGSWTDRVIAGAYLAAVLAGAATSGLWFPVLLGWALPLTIGYQAAQCARLAVEHHWAEVPTPGGKRGIAAHDELTLPIRCAVLPPEKWTVGTAAAWCRAMAFNTFIRIVVLPGDSGPSHHWHHAMARGDWANHVRAAADWEARRQAKGLPRLPDAWGYGEALRLSLDSFARASSESLQPPHREPVRRSA